MLSMNSYPKEYIDQCRARMEAQLAAYRLFVDTAPKAAIDALAPLFFSNLVIVLESSFMHRSRTLEGKDGNPLNEVRMLCSSVLQNQGVLTADKTIKYNSAKAILKIEIGQEIELTEADFVRLSQAFFTEVEVKFLAPA
ncbi:MAG: hypothetical protein ABIY70_27875 [Capsulimonas sp.]|uniref:hypothetical protein n=1 Tax=Capsulimonas sp. TaxID=2494211 RepID=UPI003264E2AD